VQVPHSLLAVVITTGTTNCTSSHIRVQLARSHCLAALDWTGPGPGTLPGSGTAKAWQARSRTVPGAVPHTLTHSGPVSHSPHPTLSTSIFLSSSFTRTHPTFFSSPCQWAFPGCLGLRIAKYALPDTSTYANSDPTLISHPDISHESSLTRAIAHSRPPGMHPYVICLRSIPHSW
jgi:hypothetical protein